MTHCLFLVSNYQHPMNILLYCSCLCCHLYESIYLFMTVLYGGFPLIYISLAHRNRVGTILTCLTLPCFVGCKMYRSTLPCRILVCILSMKQFGWNLISYAFYAYQKLLIKCWQFIFVLLFLTSIYSTLQ